MKSDTQKYTFVQLSHLLHTGIYCLREQKLISYEENPRYNPIYENRELREYLIFAADNQELPVIYPDEFGIYFICIKHEKLYYFIGPISSSVMSRVENHRFYHHYGISESWEKGLYYLAKGVKAQKHRRHTSGYTEQCKDYVQKHFREKIYLDQIAGMLGISSSYLSRLFKKDTGMCFQDYVNEVKVERSSNLLLYSNETLSMIAEYVNFPSQSYFGKIFKERRGMTPRQFREKYKPAEFIQK
jgi:AraC-like DNA-binding protein